jgi:NACHT domain
MLALSDKTKALVLVLLILLVSVLIAWFTSGWQLTALIATFQLIVIWIARNIWITDKSNFILRATVLAIISGVVLLGNSTWQAFVFGLIKQAYPTLSLPDYSVQPITLLFLLALAWLVFHYTRNTLVIDKPNRKISDLFEGPTIQQKWAAICGSLSASIRDIDNNTNWDNNYYTPLDAEVEMKTSNRTQKVVKDLLTAIKESNDRLFLLVGDPGAGKSVAVRKLCLDILETSVKDEYIPIYVNLKEWTDTKDWTKTPPTWQDLEAFVKRSLLQKNRFLADFFEKYYNVLDENGNLFFILDSFDEIPQVLGTTADAQLIQDLSIVCREFLQGAKKRRSKGILVSREYRMPRQEYLNATTKLTVRPFTFEKIEQTLTQSGQISKATVEQLLRERPELVPSMRNPFITSLLKEYLAANKNQFPKNQADLFENYIRTSINKAQANRGLAIPYDDVMDVTIQIAKLIFSEAGLQAPLSMLRQKIKHPQFDSIVEIMRYTRIARGDANNTSEFSFAHRRFYEYFVVQDLLNAGKSDLPLKSIPTDSRWRDTLVLYCEVAPFEDAQRIANYCWFDVILPNNDIGNRASKHCLRFLTEAFRGRQECLVDFHEALGEYVLKQIHVDNDPIDIKIAVEALGVLSVENLDKGAIYCVHIVRSMDKRYSREKL